MIGKTLSHFRITAKLGEGGMGEVYRAEDTSLGRDVALKVLPADVADDPERLERFRREATSIAALNHPNIVTIYSVEEADGVHLLTMELVEGQSLDQILPPSGFELDQLFPLAIQIADALAAAHEKGITHRDLKPANVMVTAENRVKVLDFGLAKLAEVEGEEAPTQLMTQAGMILGTVPYMSPEQVQGQEVDSRSDIFSLGILLYEMATGARPFQGDNQASVISSVLKEQPPSVTELKRDLPNHFGRIIRRSLEKSPQRRFQSAREVQLELEGLEKEVTLSSTISGASLVSSQVAAASPQLQSRPTGASSSGMSRRLAAAIGLGGLLLGALLAWVALRPTTPPPATTGVRHLDLVLDPQPSRWDMALSADGNTLVYTGNGPGGDIVLYIRELDGFESHLIPGTEGGVSPFFSPDEQQIGFFSVGRLKRVSLLGGLPVVLGSTAGGVTGAVWTADEEILYSTATTIIPHRINAIEGGEGEPVAVLDLESGATIQAPRLLPVAPNKALVTIEAPSFDGPYVGVLDLEDGRWKTVVRGFDARFLAPGHLLFAQEERLVVAPFSMDAMELSGPERAAPLAPIAAGTDDVAGRFYSTIAADGTLIYPSGTFGISRLHLLSEDGQVEALDLSGRFAAVDESGNRIVAWTRGEILVHDLQKSETTLLMEAGTAWYPRWSADSEQVFFSDMRDGSRGVFAIAPDGGDVHEVVTLDHPSLPTSAGPDGTVMGYLIHPETSRDIWMLSPDGDLTMVLESRYNERAGVIAPKGEWFAYISDEEGGDEVYIRQLPDSGRKWSVSTAGGMAPIWSRDGRQLLYRQGDTIMSVSVDTSGSAPRIGQPQEVFTSDRIYTDRFGNQTFDTAPDGSLVIPLTEPSDVRTRVVLNWQP